MGRWGTVQGPFGEPAVGVGCLQEVCEPIQPRIHQELILVHEQPVAFQAVVVENLTVHSFPGTQRSVQVEVQLVQIAGVAALLDDARRRKSRMAEHANQAHIW